MIRPGKIVCVGRNYVEHARELGNDVPTEPLIFLKPPSSVIADGAWIERPPQSVEVEHEGEIGIVIGAQLRRATETEAVSGIGGIVAVNDVTARDLQRKDSQWTRAKGFDTFCPVGNVHDGPGRPQLASTDHNRQRRDQAEGDELGDGVQDSDAPLIHLTYHDIGAG